MNKYTPKHYMVDKRIVQDVDMDKTIERNELFEVVQNHKKQSKLRFNLCTKVTNK
jgi:hypothetical protein